MEYLLLIVGLALLISGGNLLVDGAVAIAKKMGLSTLVIGLVLVGFGTSTPELMASLLSAFKGATGITVGNVVGSNIANILLVLGAAAFVYPVMVDAKAFKRDGLTLALSCVLLTGSMAFGIINRILGVILIAVLFVYIYYCYHSDKKAQTQEINTQKNNEPTQTEEKLVPIWLGIVKTIVGISLTVYGAKLLVDNAIILAERWGVSDNVIGLTVVAIGTSLPELTASVVASFKKENGVAFGNVVGSNIYNALFIIGSVAIIKPIQVPETMMRDAYIMCAVTAVLCLIALFGKKFSRLVGLSFLIAYGMYTYSLF